MNAEIRPEKALRIFTEGKVLFPCCPIGTQEQAFHRGCSVALAAGVWFVLFSVVAAVVGRRFAPRAGCPRSGIIERSPLGTTPSDSHAWDHPWDSHAWDQTSDANAWDQTSDANAWGHRSEANRWDQTSDAGMGPQVGSQRIGPPAGQPRMGPQVGSQRMGPHVGRPRMGPHVGRVAPGHAMDPVLDASRREAPLLRPGGSPQRSPGPAACRQAWPLGLGEDSPQGAACRVAPKCGLCQFGRPFRPPARNRHDPGPAFGPSVLPLDLGFDRATLRAAETPRAGRRDAGSLPATRPPCRQRGAHAVTMSAAWRRRGRHAGNVAPTR